MDGCRIFTIKRKVQCASSVFSKFGPDGQKGTIDTVTGDEKWQSMVGLERKMPDPLLLGEDFV